MPKGGRQKAARARELSHVDEAGRIRMVDVSAKPATMREAIAAGHIRVSRDALEQVRAGAVEKGDPLETARLAGIMAAKRTSDLIPLCHPLALTDVTVELSTDAGLPGVRVDAVARTVGKTGVEMEALTAASVALLTVYDMAKAMDRAMVIGDISLAEKSGGASGDFARG